VGSPVPIGARTAYSSGTVFAFGVDGRSIMLRAGLGGRLDISMRNARRVRIAIRMARPDRPSLRAGSVDAFRLRTSNVTRSTDAVMQRLELRSMKDSGNRRLTRRRNPSGSSVAVNRSWQPQPQPGKGVAIRRTTAGPSARAFTAREAFENGARRVKRLASSRRWSRPQGRDANGIDEPVGLQKPKALRDRRG